MAMEVRAFDALAARYEPVRYAVAIAAAAGVGLTLSGTPEASPTSGSARFPNGTSGAFRCEWPRDRLVHGHENPGESLKVLLNRFVWAQDFAARLAELVAPVSTEVLLELGKARFHAGPERDAVKAAESVWSEWPTER
jgi:hypothetical protein